MQNKKRSEDVEELEQRHEQQEKHRRKGEQEYLHVVGCFTLTSRRTDKDHQGLCRQVVLCTEIDGLTQFNAKRTKKKKNQRTKEKKPWDKSPSKELQERNIVEPLRERCDEQPREKKKSNEEEITEEKEREKRMNLLRTS
jgi:hypothetical protein